MMPPASTFFPSSKSLITLTGNSQAMLIEKGNENIDAITGVAWLDVTDTIDMSYSYVTSQLGSGGIFEGYRYATGDDFVNMVSNTLGIPPQTHWTGTFAFTDDTASNQSEMDALIRVLGDTNDAYIQRVLGMSSDEYYGYPDGSGLGEHYTYGIISDRYINDSSQVYLAFVGDTEEGRVGYIDYADVTANHFYEHQSSWNVGSFLIREIPTPAPLILMSLGLLGLCLSQRHKS